MDPVETVLCDGQQFDRLLSDLAGLIVQGRIASAPLGLVGVRHRGVPIAERLAGELQRRLGGVVPVGAVDITLYRDDLNRVQRWPVLRGTEIPFDVEGADVVLVDDVLETGRTARAALNAICDLGRPARVRLAVLADRGGRELPLQADYVGLRCVVDPGQRVRVRVQPVDSCDAIIQGPRTRVSRT